MAVTKVVASGLEGGVKVNNTKVLGEQVALIAAITDSTGGSVGDGVTINDTTSSVKDDLAVIAAKINAIIAALKAHGLVASA